MTAPEPVGPAASIEFGPVVVTYDDRVLSPRPWTLAQSRWAAELASSRPAGPILELCAGAGHIGLAAAVMADRDLVQVEVDPVAAGFARANAASAGRAGRVQVRQARLQEAVRPDERFGVILADPPYLPSVDVARWPDDPPTAIDGGADGLDLIRACLAVADEHLADGGVLLLQVAGPAQAAHVARLVTPQGLSLRPGEVRVTDDERAVMLLSAPHGIS